MLNVLNSLEGKNIVEENRAACATGCNAIPEGFFEVPRTFDADKKIDYMREKTTNMGYRFVGRHSAIKVCHWTKEHIRGNNFCYKKKFYGIESGQCIQMTPVMFFCSFNCRWCWRNFNYILPREHEAWDDPIQVLDGCIEAQRGLLQGFWGSESSDKRKLKDAMKPKHISISLSGEPTMYPYLPEFIDEIIRRKMTAYLVSNGTYPEMIRKLIDHQPTNLYISFYGTTPEMYKRGAVPMIKDFWPRVIESLRMLGKFDCNTIVRLTLAKSLNFTDPEGYAKIIEKTGSKFIEFKGFIPFR